MRGPLHMEEQERLRKELRDIPAEIRRVSALADSATDAKDRRYYREKALLLLKTEHLLLEKLGMWGHIGGHHAPYAAYFQHHPQYQTTTCLQRLSQPSASRHGVPPASTHHNRTNKGLGPYSGLMPTASTIKDVTV